MMTTNRFIRNKTSIESFLCLFSCIAMMLLSGCRTTTLDLTLDGKPPKKNRVFGANLDKTLGGGLPEGGVYSGPGVQEGMFNPARAGNGNWTITYSKFGYKSSSVDIEVYGAYETISTAGVCQKCGGKQTEVCPVCSGTKEVNNMECPECKGTGTIPCQECMKATISRDIDVITEFAPELSCSRISYESRFGRDDYFIFRINSMLGKTNKEEFRPSMFLHIVEQATGKVKKYTLPSRSDEEIKYNKVSGRDSAKMSFYYKIEGEKLIDSNIRFIEIFMNYKSHDISLLFDLDDIRNGNELVDDDMNVRMILFNNMYYKIPQTIFIDDINDKWKQFKSDKGWQLEEEWLGWLLQKNDKGEKRILDSKRMLRLDTENKSGFANDIDKTWNEIKTQLNSKKTFWDSWFSSNPPTENISRIIDLTNKHTNQSQSNLP